MSDGKTPVLYVVIPCYCEEEALPVTAKTLISLMYGLKEEGSIATESRVLFVDDGSPDGTWGVIKGLVENEGTGLFAGISLAHNRGHQVALLSGLMEALECGCDCAVSMDADLQDDPWAVRRMLEERARGAEVVYGVRSSRATDTAFKRGTARAFYRLMAALGVEMIPDSADYRLMGRKALEALSGYEEENLFLRGIVPSIGFPSARVYYERGERVAGKSKYPLGKMLSFAVEGVTSFSSAPIRAVSAAGFVFLVIALVMLTWSIATQTAGDAVPGWASLMVSLWFVGGAVMLSLGVVGEYVGKCYMESKRRPRWCVRDRVSLEHAMARESEG